MMALTPRLDTAAMPAAQLGMPCVVTSQVTIASLALSSIRRFGRADAPAACSPVRHTCKYNVA